MKKLLLGLMLAASQFAMAQLTCATATAVTPGTHTAPAITTGTYVTSCDTSNGDNAAPNSIWYSYTATANGQLVVSSNISTNVAPLSNDTRVSIYSGTCAALTCVAGNDDVSGSNYLSTASATVTAGTTYYIQWDDRWSAAGFTWSLAFTSCAAPTALQLSTITTTTATLTWTAPTPAPASYDIEYGPLGFVQGTGTLANTTSATFTFPSQPSGSNIGFYIRSNCGATQGSWMGPYAVYLVKTPPYSNNFDLATNRADGFVPNGWALAVDDPIGPPPIVVSHTPTAFYYTTTSPTVTANAQLYSRPLDLAAATTHTATFWTRAYAFTANGVAPMTLKVYINTTRSLTNATQIGTAITVNGLTHTQQTSTFTVPTSGTYYLIFSNESAMTANDTALIFDTFSITSSSLSVNDTAAENSNSVYPNPTSDILNIKSKDKVTAVSIYDMSGKRIGASVINNTVDVRALQSGTYIINIETENGRSSEKFIKK